LPVSEAAAQGNISSLPLLMLGAGDRFFNALPEAGRVEDGAGLQTSQHGHAYLALL
jgi:hypothetical protein